MKDDAGGDSGVDIVCIILQQVASTAAGRIDAATLAQIETTVRAEYGGLRVRIPKRGKHLSEPERQELYAAGLTTQPDSTILATHRVSLRTLQRTMKRGSRFG